MRPELSTGDAVVHNFLIDTVGLLVIDLTSIA